MGTFTGRGAETNRARAWARAEVVGEGARRDVFVRCTESEARTRARDTPGTNRDIHEVGWSISRGPAEGALSALR